jgi:hypothetical protein
MVDSPVFSLSISEIRLNFVLNFLSRISSSEKLPKLVPAKAACPPLASIKTVSLPSSSVHKLFSIFRLIAVHIVFGEPKCVAKSLSRGQSARGLAQSKTLRATRQAQEIRASVLECGGPPPLFPSASKRANVNGNCRNLELAALVPPK